MLYVRVRIVCSVCAKQIMFQLLQRRQRAELIHPLARAVNLNLKMHALVLGKNHNFS